MKNKTWYEKVKARNDKANKVPAMPKAEALTVCPGCGLDFGFSMVTAKGGIFVNGNWYPGSYSHCSKFKIGV